MKFTNAWIPAFLTAAILFFGTFCTNPETPAKTDTAAKTQAEIDDENCQACLLCPYLSPTTIGYIIDDLQDTTYYRASSSVAELKVYQNPTNKITVESDSKMPSAGVLKFGDKKTAVPFGGKEGLTKFTAIGPDGKKMAVWLDVRALRKK